MLKLKNELQKENINLDDYVKTLLSKNILTQRDYLIINDRLNNITFENIANKLGVKKARTYQIECSLYLKLSHRKMKNTYINLKLGV